MDRIFMFVKIKKWPEVIVGASGQNSCKWSSVYEPRREKTGLREFRPAQTQTGLYKKKRNCTIRVAKTKALISFAVTAKLICVFVFA